jgi:hypothetical protein
VEFNLRVANSDIYFEKNRLVFNVYNPDLLDTHNHGHSDKAESDYSGHAYRVNFLGASSQAVVKSDGNQYSDYTNYITGNHSISHVGSYDKLTYQNVYSGIDIQYFGYEGNLKYDVIVEAGSNPSVLRMQYEGASSVSLKNGKLIVCNVFNAVEETIPLAYQIINGVRHKVECEYVLNGTIVSFDLPNGYY